MQVFYWTVVVKRMLCQEAKLSVYPMIWARVNLRDRVRGSNILGELRVELLLLRVERSQFRWFKHLIWMPAGRLLLMIFQAGQTEGTPWGSPKKSLC